MGTPYFGLTGKVLSIYCEYFEENRRWYNGSNVSKKFTVSHLNHTFLLAISPDVVYLVCFLSLATRSPHICVCILAAVIRHEARDTGVGGGGDQMKPWIKIGQGWPPLTLNTLRRRQNGCHFPDYIFKCIFLNDNCQSFTEVCSRRQVEWMMSHFTEAYVSTGLKELMLECFEIWEILLPDLDHVIESVKIYLKLFKAEFSTSVVIAVVPVDNFVVISGHHCICWWYGTNSYTCISIVQDISNSNANTLELLQCCTEPLILFQPITQRTRARFLSLARSKLRLWSANHRPGYWSNLPCDWPSTAWAYSE